MTNENTIQLTLQFKEDGTIVVDKTIGKIENLKDGIEETQSPLEKMNSTLKNLRTQYGDLTLGIGMAAGALYGAKKMFYDTAKEVSSWADEIARQSMILGVSTDTFQRWQYAAKMADINTEEFTSGMKLLSRNLEDASQGLGDAAKYFSIMRISVKDSLGNLRPLNDVMGDIMDKFASWESGPRKVAIAMQLFGRSGEALIPMLNQGRSALEEYGNVLDPELVKKGSEMDSQFKKLGQSVKTLGEFFTLYLMPAKNFGDAVEGSVGTIMKFYSNPVVKEFLEFFKMLGTGTILLEGMKKPPLPSIEGWFGQSSFKSPPESDPYKILYGQSEEEIKIGIERARDSYKNWMEEYTKETVVKDNRIAQLGLGFEQPTEEYILTLLEKEADLRKEIDDKRLEAEKKFNVELGFEQPTQEDILKMLEREADLRQKIVDKRLEAEKKINAEIERLGLGFEQPSNEYINAHLQHITEWENAWISASEGVAGVWSSNFSVMRRSGEDFGDWFKGMWLDAADYAINQIWKISVNYALMGNMAGKYQAGAGILGMLGSLIGVGGPAGGGAIGAQGGFEGWVNRPTLFLAGESGRERVNITPEGKATPDIVNVIIENKTGLAIQKRETEITWDGKRWVKNIILELLVTDMEIRSSLKGLN
jgi:hypothetical protein